MFLVNRWHVFICCLIFYWVILDLLWRLCRYHDYYFILVLISIYFSNQVFLLLFFYGILWIICNLCHFILKKCGRLVEMHYQQVFMWFYRIKVNDEEVLFYFLNYDQLKGGCEVGIFIIYDFFVENLLENILILINSCLFMIDFLIDFLRYFYRFLNRFMLISFDHLLLKMELWTWVLLVINFLRLLIFFVFHLILMDIFQQKIRFRCIFFFFHLF